MKTVPLSVEKDYIKLDEQLEILKAKQTIAKQKLHAYHAKGYTFNLLRFSDTSGGVFSPPWKTIAMELIAVVYPKDSLRKKFFAKLAKRFPRTERTPSILIPGKKADADKIAA